MQLIATPLPFVKMSGTGNDFIIIDHRKPVIPAELMGEFARLVCRRKFSVGADGLILIEDEKGVDFKWRFFNADGSLAEMCGNGARCAARFAYMHGIAPAKMRFSTVAGVIEAQVSDINVTIRMTEPQKFQMEQQFTVAEQELTLHCVDTGVPHAVVFVDDITSFDVKGKGAAIRYHKAFQPAGTNANFCAQLPDGAWKVRTYERGVEDETQACGTGAVACALIASVLGHTTSPVEMETSGGDRLIISFDLKKGPAADNVFMKGPAHVIYQGELNNEALL